jgi:hypothetical protein
MVLFKKLTPVAFPPGLLRAETRPISTGSLPTLKMIGTVDVAALAASAAGVPPIATITVTGYWAKSIASVRAQYPSHVVGNSTTIVIDAVPI